MLAVGGGSVNKGSEMLMKTCVGNKMIIMIYIDAEASSLGKLKPRTVKERDHFCSFSNAKYS